MLRLHICVCVPCVCLGPEEVEEDAGSLGTGVTNRRGLPCVTESQTKVLWKSRKFSRPLSVSPAPARCFLIKEQRRAFSPHKINIKNLKGDAHL